MIRESVVAVAMATVMSCGVALPAVAVPGQQADPSSNASCQAILLGLYGNPGTTWPASSIRGDMGGYVSAAAQGSGC